MPNALETQSIKGIILYRGEESYPYGILLLPATSNTALDIQD